MIALEVVLGFAPPIGWAGWELWSLRRAQRRERDKLRAAAPSRSVAVGE